MSRIQGFPQEIQRYKRSILSMLPKDPRVQELPQEVHIVRSRAFPHNCIFLYYKRPTIGVDELGIVKENLVQACNQKKGPSHIVQHVMKFRLLANHMQ